MGALAACEDEIAFGGMGRGRSVSQRVSDLLDHWHGAGPARLRLARLLGAVAFKDADRGLLEVDVFPTQREQFAAAQAAERGGQVDGGVLLILSGAQSALGLADGRARGMAMGTCRGAGPRALSISSGRRSQSARRRWSRGGALLRDGVGYEVVVLDGVLKDACSRARILLTVRRLRRASSARALRQRSIR